MLLKCIYQLLYLFRKKKDRVYGEGKYPSRFKIYLKDDKKYQNRDHLGGNIYQEVP